MRTGEPTVDALLRRLVGGQLDALGTDPIGIYLFGSVVTGDFEPGVSDVDVAVVAASHITTSQLRALDQMHAQIVRETPEWDDRIDTVYVSADGLRNFRAVKTPGARISPGEPFHAIVLDDTWLIDWYQVRKIGVTLFGRPAASVIPPVSIDEYVADVRRYIRSMSDDDGPFGTKGDQAYVILTACRGLRTIRTGEYVSKREAALWASEALPQHAELIREALVWREHSRRDDSLENATATEDDVRTFLRDITNLAS